MTKYRSGMSTIKFKEGREASVSLLISSKGKEMQTGGLPDVLYHGSRFHQKELKPGFMHTGVVTRWDDGESNIFLYATTEKETAIGLGLSAAIEYTFKLERFKIEGDQIWINSKHQGVNLESIQQLSVYLYTIMPQVRDQWVTNDNHKNNINSEYKTNQILKGNLAVEKIDLRAWLSTKEVMFGGSMGHHNASRLPTYLKW